MPGSALPAALAARTVARMAMRFTDVLLIAGGLEVSLRFAIALRITSQNDRVRL
jgi:hypothetical protein